MTEFGAGFGRTAHAFLTVNPTCRNYALVDLPETLEIANQYLKKVLDAATFKKIAFLHANQFCPETAEPSDLAIQIDGFQEFDESQIVSHLKFFGRCKWGFISTAIGKYHLSTAGVEEADNEAVEAALSLGRCLTIVDPWNIQDLNNYRLAAVEAYRPESMSILRSRPSRLRPLYQLVLYEA